MSVAKNKEQYKNVWHSHISDLSKLINPDNVLEIRRIQTELQSIVDDAAEKDFPDIKICKQCEKEFNYQDVRRVFGGLVASTGHCSAACYTKGAE